MKYRNLRSSLVQQTLLTLLPQLAAFKAKEFVKLYVYNLFDIYLYNNSLHVPFCNNTVYKTISLFMYHVSQGHRRSWFSTASYLLLFSATLAQTFLIFRSLLMNFFIELYNYENNFNYTVDLFPNFSVCSFC